MFLHRYSGYTWETMMQVPMGVFKLLVREIPRQSADEDHRALIVKHSGDVKDLEERLRYAAFPEAAYWCQPKDDDATIEAIVAKARRP